jgi:hypothetical protein
MLPPTTNWVKQCAPPARQKLEQVHNGAYMGYSPSAAPALSEQGEQVESPGAQSGLGGSQERPAVVPEPTFPTDIRARTRSDIRLSADGKAETTSVWISGGRRTHGVNDRPQGQLACLVLLPVC